MGKSPSAAMGVIPGNLNSQAAKKKRSLKVIKRCKVIELLTNQKRKQDAGAQAASSPILKRPASATTQEPDEDEEPKEELIGDAMDNDEEEIESSEVMKKPAASLGDEVDKFVEATQKLAFQSKVEAYQYLFATGDWSKDLMSSVLHKLFPSSEKNRLWDRFKKTILPKASEATQAAWKEVCALQDGRKNREKITCCASRWPAPINGRRLWRQRYARSARRSRRAHVQVGTMQVK